MTPLERAARALFEYEPGPYGDCVEWAIEQDFGWRDQVDAVKLVLTAIREPSSAMTRAAQAESHVAGDCEVDYHGIWASMIDAALAEQP